MRIERGWAEEEKVPSFFGASPGGSFYLGGTTTYQTRVGFSGVEKGGIGGEQRRV